MRTLVVTLALSLLVSVSPTAQSPVSQQSLLPAHAPRLSVDFGLVQARKNLPQALVQSGPSASRHVLPFQPLLQAKSASPIDCEMVKTHRHDFLSAAMPTIKPPSDVRHHLKVVTVAPCPIR